MLSEVSKESWSSIHLAKPLLPKAIDATINSSPEEVSEMQILETELRTITGDLEGHRGSIGAIEITSDQKYIISGSSDSTIIIWDWLFKKPLSILEGHSHEVLCLKLALNNSLLISGSSDMTAKVWDLNSKKTVCTLNGHSDKVNSVAFNEVKQVVVTGSSDRSLKLWDLLGDLIHSFEGHSDKILTCITFESFLLTGSADKSIKIWNIESKSFMQDLLIASSEVVSIAITQDSSLFATAESEKNIKIWDTKTLQLEFDLLDRERIQCIKFSGNGEILVSCSDDYFNYIWDLKLRQRIFSISYFPKTPSSFAVNFDGRIVIAGCNDKTLKIWNAEEKRDEATFYEHSNEIRQIDCTNDGKSILSASLDGTVRIWDLETYESQVFQSSNIEESICYCLIRTQDFFISGHSNGLINVWDPETLQYKSLALHSKVIWSLGSKGQLLASGSKDNQIILWCLQNMEVKTILSKSTHVAVCLKFFINSNKLVSGGEDNCLKIWNLDENFEEACIKGHSDQIWALCITQDDKFIITGSRDKSIKVWNSTTLVEEFTLAEIQGNIRRLLITNDEKFLISASFSKEIKFWDWKARKEEFVLKGHTGFVRGLALISGESKLISCSDDKTVIIWDIQKRYQEAVLKGHGGWVRDLCLINESVLLTCSEDGNMIMWDMKKLKLLKFLVLSIGKVFSITADNKSRLAICGTEKNLVLVLHLIKRKVINVLAGHTNTVMATALSKDSQTAATGSQDKSIKVWDLCNYTEKFTLTGHTDIITSLVFSNDSKSLISGSEDKQVNIWNLENREVEFSFQVHSSYVTALVISRTNELFTASNDKNVKVLSLQSKKLIYCTPNEQNFIQSLCLSPDENRLAYASSEKIIVFSTKTRKIEFCLLGHSKGAIYGLKFFLNGRKLISGSADGSLKTWNLEQRCKTISWPSDRTISLCFSNDKQKLICGLKSGEVKVWNYETKTLYFSFAGHQDTVWDISVSENDRLFASASLDKTIKVWNLFDKKLEFTLKGHTDCVRTVMFLKNHEKLVSGSWDKTIRIWNLKTRKEEFCLQEHINRVICLCQDNENIVSGGADGKILFWEMAKLQVSSALNAHSKGVWYLLLDKENNQLISSSFDTTIKIWNLTDKSLVGTLSGHSGGVSCIIKLSKSVLGSSSYDKSIKIWNMDTLTETQTFSSHVGNIYTLAKLNDCEFLSCSWDKTIRMWKPNENLEGHVFKGFSGTIWEVLLSGNMIFIATEFSINIFNLQHFKDESVLMGHSDIITCLVFIEDSNLLISGSKDCSLAFWDVRNKKLLESRKEHTNGVMSLQATNDSKQVISSSLDSSIKVWDIYSRNVIVTLRGHKSGVSCLKLTRNQEILVSVSEDSTIKLWNIEKRAEISTIPGDCKCISTVLLIQNDKWFATGSADCIVKIWDLDAKREVFRLLGHSGAVLSLAESPDCKYLISGAEDFLVKVWNLNEKRLQFDLCGHSGPVRALIFDSNGILFTGSDDSTVKIWEINGKRRTEKVFFNVLNTDLRISSDEQSFGHVFNTNNEIVTSLSFPDSTFDAFYHDKSLFFNVLDSLKELKFGNLSDTASLVFISRFSFTISHFLAYLGQSEVLRTILSSTPLITRDVFRRSPFFYAINRKHLKCVEVLMDCLLILFETPESASFQTSLFAISDDFALIIKNSTTKIEKLLSLSLVKGNHGLIFSEVEFPLYSFSRFYYPSESDFLNDKANLSTIQIDPVPVSFYYLPVEIPFVAGSFKSLELLESMLDCKQSKIFSTAFVMNFIDFHWRSVKIWVFFYSLVLLTNLVFLVLMTGSNSNLAYLVILIILNVLLFVWELAQALISGLNYFKDIWNCIDIVRVVVTCVWLVVPNNQYLEILVILLNFIRGLTAFHMFDGTRFYINLIFRAVNDVKYFLLLFVYSNLMFGALYSIKDQNSLSFTTLWLDMYSLNFGIYEPENNKSGLGVFIFMSATLINLVVMLNLLISILGDSHDQFQVEKVVVDYQEKAQLALEIEKMFLWNTNSKFSAYFHVLSHVESEGNSDWEGRVMYLQRLLENLDQTFRQSSKGLALKISEKVEAGVLPGLEKNLTKIQGVQGSLKENQFIIEDKFKDTKKSLDDLTGQVKEIKELYQDGRVSKEINQNNSVKDLSIFEQQLHDCQEVLMDKITEVQESNKRSVHDLEYRLDRIERGLSKLLEKID